MNKMPDVAKKCYKLKFKYENWYFQFVFDLSGVQEVLQLKDKQTNKQNKVFNYSRLTWLIKYLWK